MMTEGREGRGGLQHTVTGVIFTPLGAKLHDSVGTTSLYLKR